MSPTNHMVRLPSIAALLVLANLVSAYPYAIPQPTKTAQFRELNVQPWPLATAAPGSLDGLLERRALNTVCGYIGGDPSLPATCSAGSHCVVDADQGVIGCCPDGGSCTQGIYTGCVDSNSGAQAEANPYVYTCQGSDVCYKNTFEGGYSQYGCGSASNLATTVAVSASGKSAIELTTLPVTRTDSETTKATDESSTSNTRSSKTGSETTTKTKSSTTETATSNTSTSNTSESSTASSTDAETSSASQTGEDSASSSTSAAAPDSDGNDNGSKNTGAIIGGTISGVAALVALVALGLFLWKRKRRNQGLDQSQPGDSNNNIQPLLAPGMQEMRGSTPPPPSMPMPLPTARSTINPVIERDDDDIEPYSSTANPYAYGSPSIGMAMSDSAHPMDHDETPLTRESREREMDEFQNYHNPGLERIEEEPLRPATAPNHSPYPGRGGGGGPLWQQNRGPGWL